jgi:hypothetical protein
MIKNSKHSFKGGFKIVATSELGGRYFLCGGQRDAPKRGLVESSPCFEYTLKGFEQRRDMVNFRTYFSLVSLTKLEFPPEFTQQSSIRSRISHCSQSSDIQMAPFTKAKFLYAIGGKSIYDKIGSIC